MYISNQNYIKEHGTCMQQIYVKYIHAWTVAWVQNKISSTVEITNFIWYVLKLEILEIITS